MLKSFCLILASTVLAHPLWAATDTGAPAPDPAAICARLYQAPSPEAFEACQQAARLHPDAPESWQRLGQLNFRAGNLGPAQAHFEKMRALGRDRGDDDAMALALNGLARVARALGDTPKARSLFEQSLALCQPGDTCAAGNHDALGYIALKAQRYDAALAAFEHCLAALDDLDKDTLRASCLYGQATVHFQRQDFPRAAGLCRQSHDLYQAAGNRRGMAASLGCLASTAKEMGGDRADWCDYQKRRAALYDALGEMSRSLRLQAGIRRSGCP